MPQAQEVVRYPSLRALKSIVGARHELARVYIELKRDLLEPQVAGRLAFILNALINTHRDFEFDAKLTELEARIEERLPAKRPNGHASSSRLGSRP
jgi:hypothetical protein